MQCYYLFSVSIIWSSRCSRSFYFRRHIHANKIISKSAKNEDGVHSPCSGPHRLEDKCDARAFLSFHLIFMSIFVLLSHFVFRMFDALLQKVRIKSFGCFSPSSSSIDASLGTLNAHRIGYIDFDWQLTKGNMWLRQFGAIIFIPYKIRNKWHIKAARI